MKKIHWKLFLFFCSLSFLLQIYPQKSKLSTLNLYPTSSSFPIFTNVLTGKQSFDSSPDMKVDSILSINKAGLLGRRVYSYNTQGKVDKSIVQTLIDTEWVNSFQLLNTYDSAQRLTSTLVLAWNINTWGNAYLDTLIYDDSGNLSLYLKKEWVLNNWQNNFQQNYYYSQDTVIIISKQYVSGLWLNSTKSIYQYKDSILFTLQMQSFNNNEWANSEMLYYYYMNGKIESILFKSWNGTGWDNYALTTFEYSDNLKTATTEFWINNKWDLSGRWIYTYISNYFTSEVKFQTWNGITWEQDDASLNIENPNGFKEHILAHRCSVFYDNFTSINDHKIINNEFFLFQNYPNPFNPITNISYNIKNSGFVSLKIFNVLGKEVAQLINEKQSAGEHTVKFDAKDLPSGVLIVCLTKDGFIEFRKMILLK